MSKCFVELLLESHGLDLNDLPKFILFGRYEFFVTVFGKKVFTVGKPAFVRDLPLELCQAIEQCFEGLNMTFDDEYIWAKIKLFVTFNDTVKPTYRAIKNLYKELKKFCSKKGFDPGDQWQFDRFKEMYSKTIELYEEYRQQEQQNQAAGVQNTPADLQ